MRANPKQPSARKLRRTNPQSQGVRRRHRNSLERRRAFPPPEQPRVVQTRRPPAGFSFKIRGAYNKIAQLSSTAAQRGVICASAGNHAQGVALGARTRGIYAVIVMPLTTPEIKVQAVADLGGEIVLHGDDYDEANERATSSRASALVFVHPFDDPDVIAGQGTIAMEIMRQCTARIDAIFVPVGGGGLIAGIAAYAKSLYPASRSSVWSPRTRQVCTSRCAPASA